MVFHDEGVEVEGIQEVTAWLDHAVGVLNVVATAAGLQAAANVIADELERRTPVKEEAGPSSEYFHRLNGGNSLDKGLLKASVIFDITLDAQHRGGEAVIYHGKYSYVANFLEYGHRLVTHGLKSIRRVIGFVKPFPFMRETAAAVAEKATEAYLEAVTQVFTAAYGDEEESEAA